MPSMLLLVDAIDGDAAAITLRAAITALTAPY